VGFNRRLKLQFHGAKLSSDGGLIVFRELDDALGLSEMAAWELRDNRTGKNSRHNLLAMFRQSLFGRVAGYDDVNDAARLSRDPVMRLISGQRDFKFHFFGLTPPSSRRDRFSANAGRMIILSSKMNRPQGPKVHFTGEYDHAIRQRQTLHFLPSLSPRVDHQISLQGVAG
jgi:hypothetical protein